MGAGYGQHGIGGRHIPQPDIFCDPYMAPKMIMVSPRMRDPAHHHEAVITMSCNRDIALDPAPFIQHQAVGYFAHFHGHVIGADPLQERFRISAFDHELSKHGIVKQHDIFAGRPLLGLRIFKPAWTME